MQLHGNSLMGVRIKVSVWIIKTVLIDKGEIMNRGLYLYKEFIEIARLLNQQLDILPVLYGSLGLGIVAKVDLSPQDIDILVPLTYLEEKWQTLQYSMELLGYRMVNLQEHEFVKNDIKIGFAFTEDLLEFADVDYTNLNVFEDNGSEYYLLTISDYVKVYNQSLQDGYRRTKSNNKDLKKVKILNSIIQAQKD